MIERYRKGRNISFFIFIIGWLVFSILAYLDSNPEGAFLFAVVLFINIWAISYFYGCYCWAKAKGFRWHVGIGLSLLSFIGILILWSLKDKSGTTNEPFRQSTKANAS